jgi:hypothetical protein
MSVVRVIPEIGVIEIIAIAQAETAAKRKAITRARAVEARARDVAEGGGREHRQAEVEEDRERRGGDAREDDRHGQAAVGAVDVPDGAVPAHEATHLAERLPRGLHDHGRHLQDRQDPRGEDPADPDRADVVEEDLLGR